MCSIREKRQPHAVAIPFPTQGHITPLLHLCKALASKGFVVTCINTEDNHSRIKNFSTEPGIDIRFETVPNELPVPTAEFDIFYKDNRVQFFQFIVDMEKPVVELMEKIDSKGPPVSCIISDMFFPWPRTLAGKLGVPHVILWTATASSLVLDYNIPQLMKHGDIPVKDAAKTDIITYLPGLSPFPTWGLPSVYSLKDEVFDRGFTRRWNRTRSIASDAWILTNSFEEIEEKAFAATKEINPNSIAIGPLSLYVKSTGSNTSLWTEDDKCLTWLEKQKAESVLYISFGSLATINFEQFLELAAGLEELQRPFMWAIRPNSVLHMKIEEFNAFKSRVMESGFGMVSSWAPQVQVLNHPSTGGFLTHCGWNSTLESICAGVPIICWPCVAEQNLNCKLVVEDWKIGLKFSKVVYQEFVNRHEFVEIVKQLMEDGGELRRNVKCLKEAAHKTVCEGGSSFNNLEKFISSFNKPSLI